MTNLQFFALRARLNINGYCLLYSPLAVFQFDSPKNFLFHSQKKEKK